MKNGKKLLSILLAALLIAAFVSIVFAASGTEGDLTWTYDEATKTLTISGSGEMETNSIVYGWYSFYDKATTLVIEDGVTSIGNDAFYCYKLLESVTIPASVQSIGRYAFHNCFALETVTIPSSVQSIGKGAFFDCTALKTVNYTGSQAEWEAIDLGELAFYYLSSEYQEYYLINCTFYFTDGNKPNNPDNHNSPDTLFGFEDNLTWIYDKTTKTLTIIGSGDMVDFNVYRPGWYEFRDEATTLVIEDGVTSIGAVSFSGFKALESVTIPDGVQSIGRDAFSDCIALESVTIPDGVQSIGRDAFYNCTALKTVNYTGSQAEWHAINLGEWAFFYADADGMLQPIDCTFNFNDGTEPNNPNNPNNPDQPDNPNNPDQPDNPNNPDQPDNPGNNQNESICKWCGKTHDNGFFQKILGFFHKIFAAVFGAKY